MNNFLVQPAKRQESLSPCFPEDTHKLLIHPSVFLI